MLPHSNCDAGSFEFTVTEKNPEYEKLLNRTSMIQVRKNGEEIFYGELRESTKAIDGTKECYTVGELAFLYDSIQPQADYREMTPRQMLETMLNIHNNQVEERKKFYIGIVTITDKNDSLHRYTNRENTLDAIREKLIEKLGGYLRIRKSFLEKIYLITRKKSQHPDITTACIPLGGKIGTKKFEVLDTYVDITTVNEGKDYVYNTKAVDRFGWVKKVVRWEDVTDRGT